MSDRQTLEQDRTAQAEAPEAGDFSALLKGAFRPRDREQEEQIRGAVDVLVDQALSDARLISGDAIRTIQAMIAAIDRKLTAQVNLILHHADYQQIEGAWRGLHHLVNNTEMDQLLKIRFMSISKKELGRTLEKFEGTAWDQSPIFKKIYTEEYSMFGGEPFGCLVGDYYFDNSPGDVALLGNMANVCAAAHTPFISGRLPDAVRHGELAGADEPARSRQDRQHAGLRQVELAAEERGQPLCRPRDAAGAGAPALWREDQAGRGLRLRGGRHRHATTHNTAG